jgi:hypothetical protein
MSTLKTNAIQTVAGKPILNSTGSILQVVSVFDNTQYVFSTGSANQSTYYDVTGLTVNITPSSVSSKILILSATTVNQTSDAYNIYIRLYRGSTAIALANSTGYLAAASAGFRTAGSGNYMPTTLPINFLDSPATTSTVNYNIKCCPSGGSSYPSYINRMSAVASDWPQGPGGSTITLMEISG